MLRPLWVTLLLSAVVVIVFGCSPATPTPAPTAAPATATVSAQVAPTDVPTKFAQLETAAPAPPISPTETLTVTPAVTATLTATLATQTTPGAKVTPKAGGGSGVPFVAPQGSGIGNHVWFMGPLIEYFARRGTYPPEPLLPRAANVNQADLVFEEIIDQRAGVFATTRFTAVFLGQNGTIRPFRSARPVNPSLVPMFDGALAHSGASKDMRFLLSQLPLVNIDDLFAGSAYCTIGTDYRSRFASTVQHLHDYLASKGLEKAVPLRGFEFSPTPSGGIPVASVAFDHLPWPFLTAGIAQWTFDAASGRYLRFMNGAPHYTAQYPITPNWAGACSIAGKQTIQQVSAANVVVINADYEPTSFIEDSNNFASAFIELTGTGTAQIYRDGVQIKGTWRRPTLQHFFEFVDASGNVIPLKPGNTWFEIAPLNYTPTTR